MRRALVLLVLLTILTAPTIVAYADDGYTISTDKTTIPVPSQSYTISGTQVSIETLTRVSDGQNLPVSVEAPVFDDVYSLILYNKQKQRVWSQTLEGDAAATVPTAQISAGTYVLVINGPDGDLRAVRPVLIAGYSVSVSHSSTGTVGQPVSISVSISEFDGQQPDVADVQVAFTTSDGVRQVNLSNTGGGEYSGNITFQEATTVELYGVVRGYERIQEDGQQEALGASEASRISISEPTPSPTPSSTPTSQPPETTSTAESGGGSGGTSGGGSSGTDNSDTEEPVTESPTATEVTVTQSPTPNTTVSSTSASPSTVTTQTDRPVTQSRSTATTSVDPTPRATSSRTATATPTTVPQSPATSTETTQSASDVITPNNPTVTTERSTTTAETPLSPVLALTALLLATVSGVRHKDDDA